MKQGKQSEAEPLLREALSINRDRLGFNHEDTALAETRLGKLQMELGRFEAAEKLIRHGHLVLNQTKGSLHPQTQEAARWLDELSKNQAPDPHVTAPATSGD